MKEKRTDKFGNYYYGEMKNGVAHGQGEFHWAATGNVVSCRWKNGEPINPMTVRILDFATYNGDVVFIREENGMLNYEITGKGRIDYDDGDCYIGGFDQNSFNGCGKIVYLNGSTIEGEWLLGKPFDEMLLKTPEFIYKGCLKSIGLKIFTPDGYGKIKYKDGDVYDGKFKDGKFDGLGKFTWADGESIEALWRDSNPTGIVDWHIGKKQEYVGEVIWETDLLPNGRGVLCDRRGEPIGAGIWHNGKLVKPDNRINIVDLLYERACQNAKEVCEDETK